MCFKYFELQDKAPTPLTTQSIGPEIYAVFSHHIKSLLRYLSLRSPDCSQTKKPPAWRLTVFQAGRD
ncbi:hypothetical protein DT183_20590 [Salmonella enterica subsp. enterica serovar London]|uniref:Uncharacterized protein n=4 Tax=Salmonella TaxID=590 RepID=A0A6C8G5M4_SALIN|nr:hypothetical protein LFZ56_15195 [Salmonella bongori serovar 66:z41:- str. SA19983605]EAA5554930.1 hypothetical protein [Salmonella enterica subsp. enterica serovar Cotham]EAA7568773.1 hypothetical protein [Salmonella enterica]EAA9551760.1 hypothetical protein [Salmonella enterica subsp. enterica]EBQ8820005.1 hypothetical protein [Salmonella enterica subsp. enterica serovar Kisarawe]EBR8778440.1 hypothetical protein [Salmonella enterica subsp. enterica serovar Wien]EBU9565532.1 hypothetica